ncbi:engulfment and cell motility protein 3 isoform X2 [Gadus macrocephalus]|uniref:engulfment and cell motility protein 3 isoform X2 n=2 Tax=Gadus TaxID=8048 RepID=UPI0028CBA007|nr:engulfment and cell motility protein 3 isoform X2 [Gadus macrocephalus]
MIESGRGMRAKGERERGRVCVCVDIRLSVYKTLAHFHLTHQGIALAVSLALSLPHLFRGYVGRNQICFEIYFLKSPVFKGLKMEVMQVVREQITRTLSSKPTSLELFKNKVNALNYGEILKLRQTERLHQEETLALPVVELKERLKPELMDLIRQQRLNRLCQGTLFRKISSRRRQDKLWYCRLSPNHKVLHYGDVEEDTESPAIESLQEKIPVADIKALLTGKDCPHMKENKGKQTKEVLDLAFSITYDVEDYSLNFIASSRADFCLWTDGLSVLLGRDMSSESMRSELEILLSMEIKLRLLDLENVQIPDLAPPVPLPPSNYHFCYDFNATEQ